MISKKNLLISPFILTSCVISINQPDVPQHREDYDKRYTYCEKYWLHDSEAWMTCITEVAENRLEPTTSIGMDSQMNTTIYGTSGT